MLIGSPQKTNEYCNVQNLGLNINGEKLCNVTTYRYLGVNIGSHLNWNQNVNVICKKLGSCISVVQRLSRFFPQIYVNKIYYAFIQPYIDYALTVWGTTSASNIGKIQRLQNRIGRIMSNNFNYDQSGLSVVNNLGWQNVTDRYQFLSCVLMYKCLNGMAPAYLADNFTHSVDIHDYNTRHASAGNLLLPKPRTEYLRKSFNFNGPKLWKVLPDDINSV